MKYKEKFLSKIFTKTEQKEAFVKKEFVLRFSKLFAAKEAAIKAIGNYEGIKWHDFEITHDKFGKPHLDIGGQAHKNILFPYKSWVTLSDEIPFVMAVVYLQPI
jgi:phosphopantetheine--protein transferase-like protein